jgi:hypothetical protein
METSVEDGVDGGKEISTCVDLTRAPTLIHIFLYPAEICNWRWNNENTENTVKELMWGVNLRPDSYSAPFTHKIFVGTTSSAPL